MRYVLLLLLTLIASGCQLIPQISHQPVVHNPFPQLTKVAIAPFFNLSTEPTVDGRQFALAYFNELQLVQGFELIPIGVVEKTIEIYRISLDNPDEVRKLAQILGADAIVIGAVTDFTPFYPPRCGLQVEWYAANPCFHTIPPGYGLPWGTKEEEFIPAPLVLESEMALARAQLKTQTPAYTPLPVAPPEEAPNRMPAADPLAQPAAEGELMRHQTAVATDSDGTDGTASSGGAIAVELPKSWPDARAFVPAAPCANRAECQPTNEPVLRHTKTYNGQDSSFTEALASYYSCQDDARFGGWQSYLQRSDDFIRFCCHLHIYEMLSARGGAGESRVVWRWSTDR